VSLTWKAIAVGTVDGDRDGGWEMKDERWEMEDGSVVSIPKPVIAGQRLYTDHRIHVFQSDSMSTRGTGPGEEIKTNKIPRGTETNQFAIVSIIVHFWELPTGTMVHTRGGL
jgi:hypothetical protein